MKLQQKSVVAAIVLAASSCTLLYDIRDWDRRCADGHLPDCRNLVRYQPAGEARKTRQRIGELALERCKSSSCDDTEECGDAIAYFWDSRPEEMGALAVAVCERQQPQQRGRSCIFAGDAAWLGIGVAEDRERAMAFYEKAKGRYKGDGRDRLEHPERAICSKPAGFELLSAQERLSQARARSAAGEQDKALSILAPLLRDGGVSAEDSRETLSLAEEVFGRLWETWLAPRLNPENATAVLEEADVLAAPLPAGGGARERIARARRECARHHSDRAAKLAGTAPAAARFHQALAQACGGPAPAQTAQVAARTMIRPDARITVPAGCDWLRSQLASELGRPPVGAPISIAVTGACVHSEERQPSSQTITWEERVPHETTEERSVTKMVKKAYSCKKVSYCSGPRCMTSYTDATCYKEEPETVKKYETVTTYTNEQRRGIQTTTQRKLAVQVAGTIQIDGGPALPVDVNLAVSDKEVRSPRRGHNQDFGAESLFGFEQNAARRVMALIRPQLDSLASARMSDVLARGASASQRGDWDAAEDAYVTAFVAGETNASPGFIQQRWALGPDDAMSVWNGGPRRSGGSSAPKARSVDIARVSCPEREPETEKGYSEPIAEFAVRTGMGTHLGILGVGLEYRPIGQLGLALGTGTHAVSGGLSLGLSSRNDGGPYLDLHGVWVHSGLPGSDVGSGFGAGATVGWDFRFWYFLSVKAGLGAAYNSAHKDDVLGHLLVGDLNAGVLF